MVGLWWGSAFLAATIIGWSSVPPLVLCAVAICLWKSPSGYGTRGTVVAAGVVLISMAGAARSPSAELPSLAEMLDASSIRGQVEGGVVQADGRQRFVLNLEGVGNRSVIPALGEAALRVNAPALPQIHPGNRIRLDGTFSPLETQPPSYRSYLSGRGLAGTFSARSALIVDKRTGALHRFESLRLRIDELLRTASPGDGGALLAGLVTGDDDSLSQARKDAFLVAGLTHVTAISGSNVALLTTVLVGRRANSRRQRSRGLMLLVVIAVWCYAIIVQLEPPVVRASLVATLGLIGVRLGRRPDYVTLTVVTAVLMVLFRPEYVRSLAFQLSFVSATALVAIAEVEESASVRARARASVVAVAMAHLAIMPLVLPLQHQLSLTALPANLLVGPLAALAFAMGLLGALVGLVWLPAGVAIAATASFVTALILHIVDALGSPAMLIPLWDISGTGMTNLGVVTAILIWVLSSEGRTVMGRWAREGSRPSEAGH